MNSDFRIFFIYVKKKMNRQKKPTVAQRDLDFMISSDPIPNISNK